MLKLQRGYEGADQSAGRYTIMGGGLKTQKKAKENYQKMLEEVGIESLSEEDIDLIKKYNLGLVGKRDE